MLKRIYFFFFSYMAAMFFAQTFLFFWLFKNGFSFEYLIVYNLISSLATLLGIYLFSKREMSARRSIFVGILFSALPVIILIKIFHPIQVYFSAIIFGLNLVFFWLPYNIMHFKFSHQEQKGLHSGMYFLLAPVVGIITQPLAGLVAERFGFEILFIVGACSYFVPLFLLRSLPSFKWEINIKKELFSRGFNWTTFLQGIIMRIDWTLVPIFSLLYIATPRTYGNFFGYLAIISALAAVINGHISDKRKTRKNFYYLFTTIAVLSAVTLPWVNNFYYWYIFVGIFGLGMRLANPFWMTQNLDYYKEFGTEKAMILREIFLNLGFFAGLLLAFFVFYLTTSPQITLAVVSFVVLFLPVVSYFQGIYREKM